MFYSNDPVSDYEKYCDYCDKKEQEWYNSEDYKYKKEKLEYQIMDLEVELEETTDEEKKEDIKDEISYLKYELENL